MKFERLIWDFEFENSAHTYFFNFCLIQIETQLYFQIALPDTNNWNENMVQWFFGITFRPRPNITDIKANFI